MARRRRGPDFRYLRDLIEQSLRDHPGFGKQVEVEGRISRIGDGLWHENYQFWIAGEGVPTAQTERSYIIRLLDQRHQWQQGPEPLQRLEREATTLRVLEESAFFHPTPKFISLVRDDASKPIGMIETAVQGISLDDFRDHTTLLLIARSAAAVHDLQVDAFPHLLHHDDRAEHVSSSLDELDEAVFDEFAVAAEARKWIRDHAPSSDHACLLHGDLLPQNLLYDWEASPREDAVVGIVDWEMAFIGDPAYDLAIVSRANRKVAGVEGGLKVLVEEYAKAGRKPVALRDVHVHEVLLVLHWLEEAWREHQKPAARSQGPDFYGSQLRSLLRRAVG